MSQRSKPELVGDRQSECVSASGDENDLDSLEVSAAERGEIVKEI